MENRLKTFLSLDYGSGYGDRSGSGYGDGCGHGSGDGTSWTYDYTNNKDIKEINGYSVHMIDYTATIITHIKNNIAKGYILNNDLTLTPCYVIKQNNLFAHGKTLHEAQEALHDKLFKELDTEERIELFREHFDNNKTYPAADFFDWHNKLTGSCLMGREAFVKNNNIDMSKDYTVKEFIKLCEHDYGGNVIQQLKEWY